MMKTYREYTKYEKLAAIQELRLYPTERHDVAVYLNALRVGNKEITDEYERFGNHPYQIFSNRRSYQRGLLFGFTDLTFNQYGWLDNERFTDEETFEFPHRKGFAVLNYCHIAKGANGKWTFGTSFNIGTSGGCSGISVWNTPYDSRIECLTTALQKIMELHTRQGRNGHADKSEAARIESAVVMKQVKDLYDEVTGRKAIQLSFLF
jgi:hypothetical protein